MGVTKAFAMTTAAALLLSTAAVAQQSPPAAREAQPPSTSSPGTTAPGMPAPRTSAPSSMDRSTASVEATGPLRELKSDTAMAPGLNVNAKELDGMDIYGADGKKVGDVNKVLADSSNAIKAVTVDVGGFLGIGAKEVVLPIDKLRKGPEKNRLQTSMTKTDIEKLAKWESPDRNMRGEPARTTAPNPPPTR